MNFILFGMISRDREVIYLLLLCTRRKCERAFNENYIILILLKRTFNENRLNENELNKKQKTNPKVSYKNYILERNLIFNNISTSNVRRDGLHEASRTSLRGGEKRVQATC